jgi:anaerobic ribonucleoside-triphosphate reductase activating protein
MHFPVYSLGPGARVGLWLSGCTLRCRGCVTTDFWDFAPHSARPPRAVQSGIRALFGGARRPDGLTISGGEPFDQPDALIELLRRLRGSGVDDILIYSGYRVEVLLERHPELPELVSALVDGPFEMENPTDSVWKGSDNQRLTLWGEKFSSRYEAWTSEKRRRLQRVRRGDGWILVGIPRQEDVERLKSIFFEGGPHGSN